MVRLGGKREINLIMRVNRSVILCRLIYVITKTADTSAAEFDLTWVFLARVVHVWKPNGASKKTFSAAEVGISTEEKNVFELQATKQKEFEL